MNIPGENLSKVHHYYFDPHPFFGTDVLVIGGKNSAAIAALELWRSGARVTLVHRAPEMHRHVKYWIKPDIENRIKNGEIKAYFDSQVVEITPDTVVIAHPRGPRNPQERLCLCHDRLPPRLHFLEGLGVRFEGPDKQPVCNPRPWRATCPASTWPE